MPYRTVRVKAEVFVRHHGVTVYCTYKDDDVDQGPREFFFVLDPTLGEGDEGAFDVRDLKTWKEPGHPPYLTGDQNTAENQKLWNEWHKSGVQTEAIKAALRAAIDQRLLKRP